MKYAIDVELLQKVFQMLTKAPNIGMSYAELNDVLGKLQKLDAIPEKNKRGPNKAEKAAKKAAKD